MTEAERLRQELCETHKELLEWDGSPEAMEIIISNIEAALGSTS